MIRQSLSLINKIQKTVLIPKNITTFASEQKDPRKPPLIKVSV